MTDNISFEKAPLVEIIAELRWLPPGLAVAQQGQLLLTLGGPDPDSFHLAFGRRPEVAAFINTEKLVPPGFPAPWHQVVWRFRNPEIQGALLQIGPGIFTANALQPYRRWSEFRGTVEQGVAALLESRPGAEKGQPFTGLTLRYVNAFSAELMGDSSPAEFMRDVLGFRVNPPAALQGLSGKSGLLNQSLNLLIPVANTSKKLAVQVGDGSIRPIGASDDVPVVLLDMTVSESMPVVPDTGGVLASFDASRNIIHETFLKMTTKIQKRMKPVKEASNGKS